MSLALKQLVAFGAIKKMPLRDHVAATSVGVVKGVPMLDLCYEEDSKAEVDMNVVMTGSSRFVELQATAEQEPFDDQMMDRLIAAGITKSFGGTKTPGTSRRNGRNTSSTRDILSSSPSLWISKTPASLAMSSRSMAIKTRRLPGSNRKKAGSSNIS
jgi:hypothetical protein